ncbi:MAG: hypothetical protein K8R34_07680 [Methanosarcinales archaeon]|nr:hypothetical protein [Methanosarcinales archaeon]
METFETEQLPGQYNYLAPDGSEIRLLPEMKDGGLSHCRLPIQGISQAVTHKTVEEIWYFIQGQGKVWRKQGDREEVVDAGPGTCPPYQWHHFQFRNTGQEPLSFIIATIPPWPGEDEAMRVKDY